MLKRSIVIVFVVLAIAVSVTAVAADRPNIILIMADDLGFSDLGCYGSEIETPTLDTLAANGMRFTQFYNTAKCHSSRVDLLTGLYCGQAGSDSLSRGATIAEVLKPACTTLMVPLCWVGTTPASPTTKRVSVGGIPTVSQKLTWVTVPSGALML